MDNINEDLKKKALDQLVEDLGMNDLPQDKKDELLAKISEAFLGRIFVEVMEKIGEDGRDEYEKLMEKNPEPQEVDKFFASKIENYDGFVTKVAQDFKEELTNDQL